MALHDDEMIIATPCDSGTKYESFKEGNTMITTMYKDEAGLEQNKLSVFLELTGVGYVNKRPGLDIVTVLDISDTMKGSKLSALKAAMRFLIDKLSSTDRLSVVTFSKHCQRLCPLRQLSVVSRAEIVKLVEGLDAGNHGKDINGGLEMALQVMIDRKYADERDAAILVMSDGNQVQGPSQVSFGTLPVYTFSFVDNHGSMVLEDIANKSGGGIFTPIHVGNSVSNNLNIAFSQCLSNLFTVVVTDLVIIVDRVNSKTGIEKFCVGTYSQLPFTASEDDIKISYGNLYAKETCKVQLDLLLPSVTSEQSIDLVHISYSCRREDKVFNSSPRLITVTRVGNRIPMGSDQQNKVEKPQGFFNIPKLPNMKILPKFEQSDPQSLNTNTKQVEDSVVVEGAADKMKGFSGLLFFFWSKGKEFSNMAVVRAAGLMHGLFNRPAVQNAEVDEIKIGDEENMTNLIKQAFDSVKIIREILSDYVNQHIRFQVQNAESTDPIRASNIEALGEHITNTFDSVKAIENILQKIGSKAINHENNPESHDCVNVIEDVHPFADLELLSASDLNAHNDPVIESSEAALLVPVEDVRTSEHKDPVENITAHVKEAFDSVKIIREILIDYVNQHAEFDATLSESSDPVRANNVKALGDRICCAFESVKAIEDILQNTGSTGSIVA